MVNCNPETVSTDYDTSDRLYFEPLDAGARARRARARAAGRRRAPSSAARRRSSSRGRSRRPATGSSARRTRRSTSPRTASASGRCSQRLGIRCPQWGIAASRRRGGRESRSGVGYPVLVRPSYVLGGRAMRVCYDDGTVRAAVAAADGPVLVDRFVESAVEIDVDALCDGEETYIGAVMQHVEEAGRPLGRLGLRAAGAVAHRGGPAGDRGRRPAARAGARRGRAAERPARDRRRRPSTCSRRTRARRGRCRSRARRPASTSSTPPAGSPRARGSPSSTCRRRAAPAAGQRQGRRAAVRALPGLRSGARPRDALDRRGDGERRRPADRVREGRARRRPAAADRRHRVPLGPRGATSRPSSPSRAALAGLGFRLVATTGTAAALAAAGIEVETVAKVAEADEGEPTVVDLIRRGRCDLVVNTPQGSGRARRRLPDPRGGARRPRAVHHDALGRRCGRARDRERAHRDRALAPGDGWSVRARAS